MALFDFLFKKKQEQRVDIQPVETKVMETIVTDDGITLSDEQANCYRLLEDTTNNYFITGKAGTGKSVILRHFISSTTKKVAVTAPTGIAAINVGGQTIHSFFGLSTKVQLTHDPDMVKVSESKAALLKELDVIVIDEISMVRVDIMDMIDTKLRVAKRKPDVPFGGCQMIVFGDLYQLPPVVGKDDDNKDSVYNYLVDKYGTVFFFGATAIAHNPFTVIELQNVHRQKDELFIDTLNRIRTGENSSALLDRVNARCGAVKEGAHYLTITPHRKAADEVNRTHLENLQGKQFLFTGVIDGTFRHNELPTDFQLKLKVGAQIMMIRNDKQKRWVNGTIGTIVYLDHDLIKVSVPSGEYSVDKETWSKYTYVFDNDAHKLKQEVVGTFTQFPIRLAYAITIHKSQGQTYESIKIDYSGGRAFEAGQTYVALSRCKSLEGVYLEEKLIAEDIKVNQEVVHFMNGQFRPIVKPTDELALPIEVDKSVEWLPDGRIKANKPKQPNKITGSRFAALRPEILAGKVQLKQFEKSPFEIWCQIMKLYREPFEENERTIAGKVIEPKQGDYIQSKLTSDKWTLQKPSDVFGEEPAKQTGYDFFNDPIFGGMWDFKLDKDGKPLAVLEMKTTSAKSEPYWRRNIPEDKRLQAALYAYLMGVDHVYMVASFVQDADYKNPEAYICNEANTIIDHFRISERYPSFENDYIAPLRNWWTEHIETGISPKYDMVKDQKVLENL